MNRAEVARLTGDSAVEIDDMDLLSTFRREGLGDSGGIIAIDGGTRHVALYEAYDLPELQVD